MVYVSQTPLHCSSCSCNAVKLRSLEGTTSHPRGKGIITWTASFGASVRLLILLELILTSACPLVSGMISTKGIRELLKLWIESVSECRKCVPSLTLCNVFRLAFKTSMYFYCIILYMFVCCFPQLLNNCPLLVQRDYDSTCPATNTTYGYRDRQVGCHMGAL